MTQLDHIEQKIDQLTLLLAQLIDSLADSDYDDDEVIDLSGFASRSRDESQPL